jgi:hypothetical protein
MELSRERTRPACGFWRRAKNIVRQTVTLLETAETACNQSPGATPELTRGTRALPIPASESRFKQPAQAKPDGIFVVELIPRFR